MSESASGEAPKRSVGSSKDLSPDWLREKYHGEGLTTAEMGSLVGFSKTTIQRRMDEVGIERRPAGKPASDERLQDASWFRKKYVEDGLSTTDIAELVDAAPETVQDWKRKHGVESVTKYKSRGTTTDNPNAGEWVETSCSWCGVELELPSRRVERSERNFCSKRCCGQYRSENVRGEDHPLYINGSHEDFGPNWREKRREARERDGYTCQGCGVKESELDRELHVHHIQPRREFDDLSVANELDNLVSLCGSCHRVYEGLPIRPVVI